VSQQDDQRTRQERREEKLRRKRERIPLHGRGLAQAYKDAILKRARQLRRKADS
jgi:hypothetical protein